MESIEDRLKKSANEILLELQLRGERRASGEALLHGCIDRYVQDGCSSLDKSGGLLSVLICVDDGICFALRDMDRELEATEFISNERHGTTVGEII